MVLALKMGCKDEEKGEKNQFRSKSSENEEFGVFTQEAKKVNDCNQVLSLKNLKKIFS
jgi:hypothetical protein